MYTNNYSYISVFDKVIAKIKLCSFLASQCMFHMVVQRGF